MPTRAPRDPLYPWSVWTQRPDPEQPWVRRGEYPDRGVALDEAMNPEPRPEPGTLVALRRGNALAWLGVASRSRAMEPAPEVQALRDLSFRSWVEAWEGPRAEGPWMLRASLGVPGPLVVLAACAAARKAQEGAFDEGASLALIEQAEAWATSQSSAPLSMSTTQGELGRKAYVLVLAQNRSPTIEAVRKASAAFYAACAATHALDSAAAFQRGLVHATELAGRAAEDAAQCEAQLRPKDSARARRLLAPVVRPYLPLGLALLARLDD